MKPPTVLFNLSIMTIETKFANFFKPEIRKSGLDIFNEDKVWITIGSDTRMEALIKTGTGFKVIFKTASISTPVLTAICTCSTADKGQLCKHIWASLLATEKKYPDFLDAKTSIDVEEPKAKEPTAFELKQAEYRKQQNEKQRLRAKEYRQKVRLKKQGLPQLPEKVQWALDYFLENGATLEQPLSEPELRSARNQLAKKIHPDLGGGHEGIVTLNKNFEILLAFISVR